MSHDQSARRAFGVSLETLTRRILRAFDAATPAQIETGARWYDEAGALAATLANNDWTPRQVAAVISHLSPRTSWSRNVAGATAFVTDADYGDDVARSLGCLDANVQRAVLVPHFPDPVDSFGKRADKTRSFYLNISGDREAVTVDVWAMRVAGIGDERTIKRVGAYDALAHAYRLAAGRRGVDPATMQATTWIVARNGRAA